MKTKRIRLNHEPRAFEARAVKAILRHANPGVTMNDLRVRRPSHHVSTWRAVVCYIMNERLGVPFVTLATWFGITPLGVQKGAERIQEAMELADEIDKEVILAAASDAESAVAKKTKPAGKQ